MSASRTAGLVGAGILVSRVFGFIRTFFIARFLGTSAEHDAYLIALRIPNAIRNLFGEGTLSAAFIPVYSALLENGKEKEARILARSLLGAVLIAVSILTISGIVASPFLVAVLAPGFDAERTELAVRLTRVLFPMVGMMVLSGWCLGVQNSHKEFFWSYASAAMWSLVQIILLVIWGPIAETTAEIAWWLAWATLGGALLQIMVQLPVVLSLIGSVNPLLPSSSEHTRKVLTNILPVTASLGVVQLSGFADGFIASFLPEGSVAVLSYANQLMLLPVALFGISVSSSSLPDLARFKSRLVDNTEIKNLIFSRVQDGLTRILFHVVPSMCAFIVFGDMIIAVLLRSGKFGMEDQYLVHITLIAYSIALISFASNRLFSSTLHAMQDYRTPLRYSVFSVVTTIVFACVFSIPWKDLSWSVSGIALGAAVGSWLGFVLYTKRLRKELGHSLVLGKGRDIIQIFLVSILSALIAYSIRIATGEMHRVIQGPLVLFAFSVVYISVLYLLGSAEAKRWLKLARIVK